MPTTLVERVAFCVGCSCRKVRSLPILRAAIWAVQISPTEDEADTSALLREILGSCVAARCRAHGGLGPNELGFRRDRPGLTFAHCSVRIAIVCWVVRAEVCRDRTSFAI